jgi:hypothetical protein
MAKLPDSDFKQREGMGPHSRGMRCPRLAQLFTLSARRGRRESRVRAAPAVSRANAHSKTHTSIQVQRRQSGLPCAIVLTVSFVLLCPGSFATVASRISGASQPGWAAAPPQDLTPASGCQDHTTSPYAATSFVSSPFDRSRAFRQPALHHVARKTLPRPPHPHPASVTIAIRPSGGVRRAELNQ